MSESFGPATRAWFAETFAKPTQVQARGWPAIAKGQHSLLIAPTGSGKTLAAFLSCIDRLAHAAQPRGPGICAVYVSPLKALVYDIERNLRAPLAGIARVGQRDEIDLALPRVAVRTGDTSQKERRAQLKKPSEILVTTPESLYLLLGSQARENFATVETIIVDEVHALAPSKRGAHLALSLERLSELCTTQPQRIGLSATAKPLSDVAGFLGGDREVEIIDASARPAMDLQIVVPVQDMTNPSLPPESVEPQSAPKIVAAAVSEVGEGEGDDFSPRRSVNSIWPAVHPRLLELIRGHRSTIVFVNSRGLCERLVNQLNELADEQVARAHHGSVAHEQRREIEEALKEGRIPCIVSTSSLELGIDMGAVELVVLVESPGAVASGLQRIGRAGHAVGEISKGRVFPKHRGDLLECTVVAARMREGDLEPLALPRNPLDVLAQQIVAICAARSTVGVDELRTLVMRAANFRELPEAALTGVLDMLSGRYPSTAFSDLRPRINWDRDRDELSPRRGAKILAAVSGGTIPNRGLYTVHLGEGGPRLGELDEEMVHETPAGQTFTLGASTWRVETITRDRVIVSPAPGEPGKLPFWRGDGPGRPVQLGQAIGAFVRQLERRRKDPEKTKAWLQQDFGLDEWAADNLLGYIEDQREYSGVVPTDKRVVVERFRDEIGDWRVCILTPFGARVHAPWALAVQARLSEAYGFDVQALWSDDGIVFRFVEIDDLPELELLVPEPEDLEDLVVSQVRHSAVFAGQFRENAARALLLPRRRPNERTPLWAERLKAQQLLAVARDFPAFPIIMESYRACLQDVFDLPALTDLLERIRSREIRVEWVETRGASPFGRSLMFAYVATYLYEGDAPLAERRAQALTLDRDLLRELLGHHQLRELLDAGVIDEVEAELQGLAEERRARNEDHITDLLRRVGDLSRAELELRCEEGLDVEQALTQLKAARRVFEVRVAGEVRLIAAEDAGLYRDGLGAQPPPGVPRAFLMAVPDAAQQLLGRYAKTHGPFVPDRPATRLGLGVSRVEGLLEGLLGNDELVRGAIRPDGRTLEYCDPEVLRRIKRRTLAKLRGEAEPVDSATMARFLPRWHGVGEGTPSRANLEDVLIQLEGLPLSYVALEREILPARVRDFRPEHLDALGARGHLVWIGRGPLGSGDGKVALYRRERVADLVEVPPPVEDPVHAAVIEHLGSGGASFFVELERACRPEHMRSAEFVEVLWDLAWSGHITNDTFAPLRARGGPRRGKRAHTAATGGRWSLVTRLVGEGADATRRGHARAVMLLERHGIVTREAAALEQLPGGFSAIYPVLKMMEETGKVRRGYFIEGLGGAQFAFPGAVDRLRGIRSEPDERELLVVSAVDPANPYGWLLPWPPTPEAAPRPRRVGGARVVLVDGQPVLYLERGNKGVITFGETPDRRVLETAVEGLRRLARTARGRLMTLERIDGTGARESPLAPAFREAGLSADHKGLLVEAS